MKLFVVVALFVAAASAAPATVDGDAQILRFDSENIGVGNFGYSYETSNGIAASETGELKTLGPEETAMVVRGQFSYVGPDGTQYLVTYTADENGFHPEGAHIPKAQ